ncbi:MAG: exodeoxyribonuclease VII large subunit [SAR202 cluster bacterium]|nr:exodeoxyribonuclease VII large subunit [SAR202 cluster bacterium]
MDSNYDSKYPVTNNAAIHNAYTVTAISEYLKSALESDPRLADITVIGEVSGYRNPSSGHHYFSLRDEQSVIRSVMFRSGSGARFLSDGSQVICHGTVSIYTARGDLQLYVNEVSPDGIGALQQAYEKLRKRLEAEGLFDIDRKRELPKLPDQIAVITSPTGAVIQDVLNVLTRRYPLATVILIPTSVQGEKSAPEIVKAFEVLNSMESIDVAIVARGGGSLEDLWAFNEEIVARAIFSSNVPVISAIGHETDNTIADHVADRRAATPSAAAEIVAPDITELAGQVDANASRIEEIIYRNIHDKRSYFEMSIDRMNLRAPDVVLPRQKIDDLLIRAKLAEQRLLESSKNQLATVKASLNALNPTKILGRGYAIAKLVSGNAATSASQFHPKDKITVILSDGSVDATVNKILNNSNEASSTTL